MQEHVNVGLRSIKSGNSISLTLSGQQVEIVATALLDTLTAIGEVEDKLGIFGGAVRIGNPIIFKRPTSKAFALGHQRFEYEIKSVN